MSKIVAPLFTLMALLAPSLAHAADAAGAADTKGTVAIAMALAIGLAVIGGALGQGRAAASVLEGICRNPGSSEKAFVPMILGLAFIESLVIFAFVVVAAFIQPILAG